ncbi:MAG: nuclear transport factor 2 family protein [Longimicrobiales bacterium]|nr:nuclear transport factor 2 family protein [Longimicrobiales bacterium]
MDRNQTLLEAFAGIRRALLENDADALRKLVAHDYCGFDPTGAKHDRHMLLQSYGPGGVQLTEYETSEITARVIGDVGLVMGVGAIRGSFDGQQFAHKLRFLDVYVHSASWLLSVSHVSELKLR